MKTPDASIALPARIVWGKGQVLAPEYRKTSFKDWDRYGLPPAPEGCQWMCVGRDACMLDLTSGEIAGAFIGVLTNWHQRN